MKLFLLLGLLLTCNNFLLSAQERFFEGTLENINKRLEKWTEGRTISVTANRNGNINIINIRKETFQFNFNMFDLLKLHPEKSDEKNGIELDYCNRKSHAPSNWINFNTDAGSVAFIRLKCNMPVVELNDLYNDFVLLKTFCKKDD